MRYGRACSIRAVVLVYSVFAPSAGIAQEVPAIEMNRTHREEGPENSSIDPTIARQVRQTYGLPLQSLHLPDDKFNQVKELIARRIIARQSAARSMPLGLPVAEQKQLIDQADGEVDRKIQALVEPPIYEKIEEMVSVQSEMDNIVLTYAPAMTLAGVTFDGTQLVSLAKLFKRTYSDVDAALMKTFNFEAVRSAKTPKERARAEAPLRANRAYRTKDIDPLTGLSAPDRDVMSQAASFLSPGQLSILQKKLAEITHGWRRRAEEKNQN